MLSVIIPHYNRVALLMVTLDNLLSQTFPASEIIVVDDNSTESLAPLQERYGDSIILVKNALGKGPGGARNTGIKIATGKYLKFFDSDDLLSANCNEMQVRALERSGKGFCISPYIKAIEKEGTWEAIDVELSTAPLNLYDAYQAAMCKGFFTQTSAMLFHADFVREVGYWKEVTVAEDYDYFFRALSLEPNPSFAGDCLTIYRQHLGSTMGNADLAKLREVEKLAIFKTINENFKPGSAGYSPLRKLGLEVLLANHIKFNQINDSFEPESHPLLVALWQKIYLIENKIGRLLTKSNWQPFHKPNTNNLLFKRFLEECKAHA